MASKSRAIAAKAASPRPIQLVQDASKTPEQQTSDAMLGPAISNALTALTFANFSLPKGEPNEAVKTVNEMASRVHGGDLKGAETMLVGQAVALNAMFGELSRRAAANLGHHVEATETYLRLALKAQTQCRATLETLGEIKNPPIVYAKQANFAAGHQQVNNGIPQAEVMPPQKELLKDLRDGEWMDAGAAGATSAFDSIVATLGAGYGSAHDRRKATVQAKRLQGREPAATSGVRPVGKSAASRGGGVVRAQNRECHTAHPGGSGDV